MGREMEAAGAEAGGPRAEPGPAGPASASPPRVVRHGRGPQPSPREEELLRARSVARPVALLALIDRLENWKVGDDLIAAVVEAAEAGIDIDSLYEEGGSTAVETADEKDETRAAPTTAAPIPVYRLGDNTLIHFSKDGKPIGPPIQYFFTSKLGGENAFGCELTTDAMISSAAPYFRRGDILIFSIDRKIESGDFAFVKTRSGDEFLQVFFLKDEAVRLRPLNAKHPERTVRRAEVKALFKLIGRYQEL